MEGSKDKAWMNSRARGESTFSTDLEAPVAVGPGALVGANVTIAAVSGDEVGIKVHSRRQNNAYYVYTVP